MIHVPGRAGRVHVLRLMPGEDVRHALTEWTTAQGLQAAGIISAVGSLSRAMIRYAGREEGTAIMGDLEICTLSGTLSQHGVHLHITVADAEGQVRGGHVMPGCIVRTTLELVVQEINGVEMQRTLDPEALG